MRLVKQKIKRKSRHYSNLQPLWAKDNIRKGGRTLDNTKTNDIL